jgi:hypothetical protein
MAQVQTGSVAVTNESNRVIASAGNDWSGVAVNHWFSVVGSGEVYYVISSVTDPAHSASGKWEITLGANYAGITNLVAPYNIVIDFSPVHHLPIPYPGDTQTAQMIARLVMMLDALV